MPPGKIYLELDAYELGQVVALLPDVAWNRMERELRNKFKAAQEEIAADRKPKPKRRKTVTVKIVNRRKDAPSKIDHSDEIEPQIPDDHVPIVPEFPELGTPTEIVEDLRGEQTPDESVDRSAIETPNPSDDDFFE